MGEESVALANTAPAQVAPLIRTDVPNAAFDAAWPAIERAEGWLVRGQERCLFELAAATPPDGVIMEIGSYLGRSTCALGAACAGTRRHIFAIDTFAGNDSDFVNGKNDIVWDGDSFLPTFVRNLEAAGVRGHVTPLRAMSSAIAPLWCQPLDLLFIDAGHGFEAVMEDINNFTPHVKPGGIIALHDVTPGWPGVYKAWHDHLGPRLDRVGSVASLAYGLKRSPS